MTDEHKHNFRPALISLPDGAQSGGRCRCGMEVVGTRGPFRLNADFVRAGQQFNAAMVHAMRTLNENLRRARDE